MKAYGQSKLAEMLFALELDRRSRAVGWGIVSNTAHPGLTLTNLQTSGWNMGRDRPSARTATFRRTSQVFPFLVQQPGPGRCRRCTRRPAPTRGAAPSRPRRLRPPHRRANRAEALPRRRGPRLGQPDLGRGGAADPAQLPGGHPGALGRPGNAGQLTSPAQRARTRWRGDLRLHRGDLGLHRGFTVAGQRWAHTGLRCAERRPAEPRRLERKTFPPRRSTRRYHRERSKECYRTDRGGSEWRTGRSKSANGCQITTLFRLLA